jgi:hypothetical protein
LHSSLEMLQGEELLHRGVYLQLADYNLKRKEGLYKAVITSNIQLYA